MTVYETSNDVCETLVTSRTSTLERADRVSSDLKVAFHEYTLDAVETTSLSCCLAAEDYSENVNACEEVTTHIDEYTFDQVS